jgi:FKBP-type peptidyl-prolyl cis-trans isomerase FklB
MKRLVSGAALACAITFAAAAPATDPLSPSANDAYLATNAHKPGVVAVPGIQYRVVHAGKGAQPVRSDCVTVYYKGSLINGKVFDETKPNQPATFPAGALIPGWTEALQLMHEGDEWELVIPPGLAYGTKGAGNVIPPNQTLVFDIQLLKIGKSVMGQCT